jgi:hypothetical protein
MPDRVHPAVSRMQPTGVHPAPDRRRAQAGRHQLMPCDEAVLATGDRSDREVRDAFFPHTGK